MGNEEGKHSHSKMLLGSGEPLQLALISAVAEQRITEGARPSRKEASFWGLHVLESTGDAKKFCRVTVRNWMRWLVPATSVSA